MTFDCHEKQIAWEWGNIPEELRQRAQWCVAGADKAPLNPHTLHRASVKDKSTWADFETAKTVATKHGLGIGYVFTADDPYACIDLDVKPETDALVIDLHDKIVRDMDSYTEYSRSGKGRHVVLKGNIGSGCRRNGVEVYSQERFMIFTGKVYLPRPIEERPELLAALVAQISAGSIESVPLVELPALEEDRVIYERAIGAANGQKFAALCKGDWKSMGYPSQSEADFALLSMLAFFSYSNEQCRRMFRQTELGKRDKVVTNNAYLNRSLQKIRSNQAQEIEHGKGMAARLLEAIHTENAPWPDFMPLIEKTASKPYPLESLPNCIRLPVEKRR